MALLKEGDINYYKKYIKYKNKYLKYLHNINKIYSSNILIGGVQCSTCLSDPCECDENVIFIIDGENMANLDPGTLQRVIEYLNNKNCYFVTKNLNYMDRVPLNQQDNFNTFINNNKTNMVYVEHKDISKEMVLYNANYQFEHEAKIEKSPYGAYITKMHTAGDDFAAILLYYKIKDMNKHVVLLTNDGGDDWIMFKYCPNIHLDFSKKTEIFEQEMSLSPSTEINVYKLYSAYSGIIKFDEINDIKELVNEKIKNNNIYIQKKNILQTDSNKEKKNLENTKKSIINKFNKDKLYYSLVTANVNKIKDSLKELDKKYKKDVSDLQNTEQNDILQPVYAKMRQDRNKHNLTKTTILDAMIDTITNYESMLKPLTPPRSTAQVNIDKTDPEKIKETEKKENNIKNKAMKMLNITNNVLSDPGIINVPPDHMAPGHMALEQKTHAELDHPKALLQAQAQAQRQAHAQAKALIQAQAQAEAQAELEQIARKRVNAERELIKNDNKPSKKQKLDN